MFKVLVHRKARREIASLPDGDRIRLLTAIKRMGSDPFVGDIKPLRSLTLCTAEAGRFLLLDENVETDVHLSVEGIVCKNLPA
jgi:hypothetical protein